MVPLGFRAGCKYNGLSLGTVVASGYQYPSPVDGQVTERLERKKISSKGHLENIEDWQWPFTMYYMSASFDSQHGEGN